MIEIRGLKKSFGKQQVLRGINLEVGTGELLAVIGMSGGGKSVLLKHLIGLLKPDSGEIFISGQDIVNMTHDQLDEIRSMVGVLFQGGALFDSMNVFENVSFPLKEKTRMNKEEINSRTYAALEDVGLSGMGHKYPAEISGGMRKRVGLARALISEPSIVLFDEPTTGLDPITLNSIHRLIKSTQKKHGFTGVIISHEIPEIFDIADRIAVIYQGAIVQSDTPDAIRNSTDPIVQQFISGGQTGPIKTIS
ncbi:MAG: ABC transporter ATP-binding protein [Dissulfurispiraceae bacterium]|jgi:phospholipid/cholesterol/gamma-HCH transport system ATP-binding protein|nr:ABC transporter ATP-binding protein [Dissulfurispiraceae bacterium]